MSSNLTVVAVLLAALVAVAYYTDPEREKSPPCCPDKGHQHSEWGEIGYCQNRDS
jgi:hypothetical protein